MCVCVCVCACAWTVKTLPPTIPPHQTTLVHPLICHSLTHSNVNPQQRPVQGGRVDSPEHSTDGTHRRDVSHSASARAVITEDRLFNVLPKIREVCVLLLS